MKIEKQQSHQIVFIRTKLAQRIEKVAEYMGVTPNDWINDRLEGQLLRFHWLPNKL